MRRRLHAVLYALLARLAWLRGGGATRLAWLRGEAATRLTLLRAGGATRLALLRAAAATRFALLRGAPARGQGTVEYVALILLVAGVLAGVVAAAGSFGGKDIGATIVTKLKDAIESVGKAG